MATDLETKAKEALIADQFELAVELYSQAIVLNPNNAKLFADRAQANIKLANFTEAVADANKAIQLDSSMAKAYLQKGTACMKLEEYQTAKTAFQAGAGLAPEDSRFKIFIKECDERIAEENASLPKPSVENTTNAQAASAPAVDGHSSPTTALPVSKPKFRHEFYQKHEEVVVTVFAKGIPAKDVAVDFGEQILSVTIDLPGEEPYHLQPRLFGKIIPAKCRYDVLSTKIEIRLAKAEPIQWTSLEYVKDVVPLMINFSTPAQRPSYPSSKRRGVDWYKLEARVKKEEKDEYLDGDAALNKFFQDIYGDADEDTRRAMLKSFEPNASIALHLHQSDPYFVAKSRMNRTTGLLINHSHWHTLALVFKAIMRMKTIVSPGRELTKLHCCLFPDDYEFERETLVQLWMAVGFLGEKRMENTRNIKFDILLEGQYILPARIDILTGRSKYKVNFDKVTTLLNGIQTIRSENLCAMLEDENASVVGSKCWHVSIVSNHIDQEIFETLKTFNELRTLLFVRNYGSFLKQIPSDLFLALKSIQALDLSGSHITELPSSIGNVIHLRYLDLSFTLIESLPESIDRLHQLQTLRLEGCMHLYNLPDGMKELTGLRHFVFDVLGQLTCMPKGIGALTKLCTLSAFIVDSGEGCPIRELKYMNNLKGSFCISGLENATGHEARTATLCDKNYLTRLQLRWNDFKSYDYQKRRDTFWTTYFLKPNSSLEELQILYYPGLELPPWMGYPEFKNLFSITLIKCAIEELHIKLGKLPNLRYLNMTFMYGLTGINYRVHYLYPDEHICSFPKLETLELDGMPKLVTWDGVRYGDFAVLSKLIVKQCPKLSVLLFLPHLPSLKHLEISHCKLLKSLSDGPTLSRSLKTLVINACPLLKKRYIRGGEGWLEIEHIQQITIDLKSVRSTQEDGAAADTSSARSDSGSECSDDDNIHPCDSC